MKKSWWSLGGCQGLELLVKQANNGRSWKTVPIVRIEVWHEWLFSQDGIRPRQPKWVNTTSTQPNQPTQATPVPNLVLAGAHTRTEADVWSRGRRGAVGAAQVIEPSVRVIPQYKPAWLRAIAPSTTPASPSGFLTFWTSCSLHVQSCCCVWVRLR